MKLFNLIKNYFSKKDQITLSNEDLEVKLKSIKSIEEILELIVINHKQFGIKLNKGASESEITEFEKVKGLMPDDFKKLYKTFNGFYSKEDMFRIIPLNEILKNGNDLSLRNENDFYIAEYMIYSDEWTLSVNSQIRNNYIIYEGTDTLNLTDSLTEFLCVFIAGGVFDGLYKWREEMEN